LTLIEELEKCVKSGPGNLKTVYLTPGRSKPEGKTGYPISTNSARKMAQLKLLAEIKKSAP